jgi:hypothetical protein
MTKEAAKMAAKSFLRYLIATFGVPAVVIATAAILVLVVIYAVMPASGIPGSSMDTRAKAVAYYQGVTDQVNPKPQASLYPELEQSHLLNFGLLYAVDFFSNNLSGVQGFQSNAQALGEGLKPIFTYVQRTKTVTVIITGKQGTSTTKTQVILTLLSKADTYQGIYTYTYKPVEYVLHPSKSETIIIDTWELAGSQYQEDWTRFNTVVEKYTGLNQVTKDDRDMILQSAATLQTGTANLDWMMGGYPFNPGAGAVLAEIPAQYLAWFKVAGAQYGVPWYVLAAIAKVESDFNPDCIGPPNYTGELAEGLMQFLPSTWSEYGRGSPFDPQAAIFAAARMLAAEGAAANLRSAIYDYNHAAWYVDEVMSIADRYEKEASNPGTQGGYAFPVAGQVSVISVFGNTTGRESPNQGIDLAAPEGTPVVAFTAGTVSLSQGSPDGNILEIHGQDGNAYVYMDLEGYAVADGATVQDGQLVGYVGETPDTTRPYLHFEVRVNGTPTDPEPYLALAR